MPKPEDINPTTGMNRRDEWLLASLQSRMRWAIGTTFEVRYSKGSRVAELANAHAQEVFEEMTN